MMKKIIAYTSGIGTAIVALLSVGQAHAQAAFSTTTLGTAIDTVSGTTYDYFTVLIAKFWPFLLGAVILVGVVVFGKRIIHALFGK